MFRNTPTATLHAAADALSDFLTSAQVMCQRCDFNPDLLAELRYHQQKMQVELDKRGASKVPPAPAGRSLK